MDSDYIQHVRYKLQKRLKRLNTATRETFRPALVQTWAFLQSDAITKAILDDLEMRVPEAKTWAEGIIANEGKTVGENEIENDAIAYWVVKSCATVPLSESGEELGNLLLVLLRDVGDQTELFRVEYVEPLFDHIDERIDDRRMMLALLRKYKHRCEWFRREALIAACRADTRQGEKTLAYDLYEYLHDQGVEFHIEPQSESGRVDLVSAQSGRDRLVADAKIFNPASSHDRGYIVKGFRQVYEYAKDYNEPFAYLVIFKTCEDDLSISTPKQESGVSFITHNNKTIFLVVIDIFDYAVPASKRSKLKTHEITADEFIESIP